MVSLSNLRQIQKLFEEKHKKVQNICHSYCKKIEIRYLITSQKDAI